MENVKRLIKDTFPEDPHTAISVARCESGLKANAVNKNNPDGSIDGGLWQINSMHDSALERMGLDKWNVEDATKFARHLYDSNGGWRDWMCYTRGMITMR